MLSVYVNLLSKRAFFRQGNTGTPGFWEVGSKYDN